MDEQHQQQVFEKAVSSGASIVKPTLPKNVLSEFQHFAKTGNRYGKQNPFDEDETKPEEIFQEIPQPQVTRRAAPPPPSVQEQEPAPSLQDPFLVSKPNIPVVDEEKNRLINSMQQHLRSARGGALTVGELSAQVKEFTGQSWGGYWEAKYGALLTFLRNNPMAFSVIKSKYVSCPGQEQWALQQIEKEESEAKAQLEEKQRQELLQKTYASTPMNALPSNTSYYQQQSYNPAPSYNPYTSFQSYPPSTAPSYFDDPFNVSNYPPAPPQQQQQSYMNDYSSYAPLAPTSMGDPMDWGRSNSVYSDARSGSVTSRADASDWQLPPTDYSVDPSFFGAPQPDDWWKAKPSNPDPFAFAGFDASIIAPPPIPKAPTSQQQQISQDEEEAERIRKAELKQLKAKKKQEEKDEALAAELQKREYDNAMGKAALGSKEKIVLTTSQMRDLAEKELGIDNVRIIAGFTVKKYGREGRPHQRKMWVTQSLTHLAWASSLLEGSHRGIELKHVTEVTTGQMTPTIARTTSDKNKVRAQCFSLVTQARTLDMQACSVIQRDALVGALRSVVAFNHKYQPEKVDRDLTRVNLVGHALQFQKDD